MEPVPMSFRADEIEDLRTIVRQCDEKLAITRHDPASQAFLIEQREAAYRRINALNRSVK
jgi:hypothetical protein